jgi:ABC-2 type transport system ATP-binding protein
MSAPLAPPPIEADGVTKVFPGPVRALDGASFSIAAGERACLLGPNGAGKTTLIRLLTGVLSPTAGSVRLFGRGAESPDFLASKRRVGIVPQLPGMYRDLSVQEYLTLVARLYGRGEVSRVIEAFGLGPYVARPMAQLSGGWQRRLSLAAALLPEPELLLLDEPTVGLDPIAAREVHASLREMMRGRTTLLCTHNLVEAEALCTSVVILRAGRVLLHEPIERLRSRVAPRVELAARQGPEALGQALRALGHTVEVEEDRVRVTLSDPPATVPTLLRALLAEGLEVFECRVRTPSLEDLFHQIVGGDDARS